MQATRLLAACLAIVQCQGQSVISFTNAVSTLSSALPSLFTGSEYTYLSTSGQIVVTETSSVSSNGTATSSGQKTLATSTGPKVTQLVGATPSSSNSTTGSSTSTAPVATNTQPCNNYPEFCNRKYSNITEICAHNSAFSKKNNAASNQVRDVTAQLDDGVRMIQGETWKINGTIYSCHTSCDLLNAGTYQSFLTKITNWLDSNPYEVVTLLIGNSNFSDGVTAEDYVDTIQNSGISKYLYTPDYVPQYRSQWPTLGEMIISQKRVVVFMDYNANQTAVPYILDEYSHFWSTPFSPTDQNFPCTLSLPPDLNETKAREDYMYIANHNLNTDVSIGSFSLLIPNTAEINDTNSAEIDKMGSAQNMTVECNDKWGNPPNFLVIDYYNYGSPHPCSVFQVAAEANGVKYGLEGCRTKVSASSRAMVSTGMLVAALGLGIFWAV